MSWSHRLATLEPSPSFVAVTPISKSMASHGSRSSPFEQRLAKFRSLPLLWLRTCGASHSQARRRTAAGGHIGKETIYAPLGQFGECERQETNLRERKNALHSCAKQTHSLTYFVAQPAQKHLFMFSKKAGCSLAIVSCPRRCKVYSLTYTNVFEREQQHTHTRAHTIESIRCSRADENKTSVSCAQTERRPSAKLDDVVDISYMYADTHTFDGRQVSIVITPDISSDQIVCVKRILIEKAASYLYVSLPSMSARVIAI